MGMLLEVMQADGVIDEREEMAIGRIEKTFSCELRFSLSRKVTPVGSAVSGATGATVSSASAAASKTGNAVGSLGNAAGGAVSAGFGWLKGSDPVQDEPDTKAEDDERDKG